MAVNNINLNLNIDVQTAEQQINEIRQSLQNASSVEFNNISTLDNLLSQANDEAQRMAIVFGTNSQQFNQARDRVVALTNEVENYNQMIENSRPGNMFQNFANGVNVGISSIQTLQGTLALFGSENEEVNKSVEKLVALLNLSQGIKNITDMARQMGLFRGVSVATTAAIQTQTAATNAQTTATTASTVATASATNAVRGFNAALSSNVVGLALTALASLAVYFYNVSKAADEAEDSVADFQRRLNELNNAQTKNRQSIIQLSINDRRAELKREEELAISTAKLQGKSEQDQLDIRRYYSEKRKKLYGEEQNIIRYNLKNLKDENGKTIADLIKEENNYTKQIEKNRKRIETLKNGAWQSSASIMLINSLEKENLDLGDKRIAKQKEKEKLREKEIELIGQERNINNSIADEDLKYGKQGTEQLEIQKKQQDDINRKKEQAAQEASRLREELKKINEELGTKRGSINEQVSKFRNEIISAFSFIRDSDAAKALNEQNLKWQDINKNVKAYNLEVDEYYKKLGRARTEKDILQPINLKDYNDDFVKSEQVVVEYFSDITKNFTKLRQELYKFDGNELAQQIKRLNDEFKPYFDNLDSLAKYYDRIEYEAKLYYETVSKEGKKAADELLENGEIKIFQPIVGEDLDKVLEGLRGARQEILGISTELTKTFTDATQRLQKRAKLELDLFKSTNLTDQLQNQLNAIELQFSQVIGGSFKDIETAQKQLFDAQIAETEAYYDLQIELAVGNAEKIIEIEKQKANALKGIETERTKASIELEDRRRNAILSGLNELGGALTSFSQLAAEGTAEQKGLAIAGATIDTIAGAIGAFMNYAKGFGPAGPILGAIAAAGVTAAGIANIKKIAAVQIPGAGSTASVPPIDFTPPSFSNPLEAQGVQDVRVLNDNNVIELQVTDQELQQSENRRALNNSMSSF